MNVGNNTRYYYSLQATVNDVYYFPLVAAIKRYLNFGQFFKYIFWIILGVTSQYMHASIHHFLQ